MAIHPFWYVEAELAPAVRSMVQAEFTNYHLNGASGVNNASRLRRSIIGATLHLARRGRNDRTKFPGRAKRADDLTTVAATGCEPPNRCGTRRFTA